MAVTTIAAAITQLQTYAATLTGIRTAPTTPPATVPVTPMIATWSENGEHQLQAALRRHSVVTLTCRIVTEYNDLSRNMASLNGYLDTFPALLMKYPNLGGTVDAIVFPIRHRFVPAEEWGSTVVIGYDFFVTVKLQTAVS